MVFALYIFLNSLLMFCLLRSRHQKIPYLIWYNVLIIQLWLFLVFEFLNVLELNKVLKMLVLFKYFPVARFIKIFYFIEILGLY